MSNAVLAGSLKFLNLGDIMQLLGSNASTGVLRVTGKYSQDPGLIYFIKGNPVNASTGSLSGIDAVNLLFGWVDGEFEFSEESVTSENIIKKSRMEILLDGLSMLDDGHIEKLGPVSFEKDLSGLPVIKGPLVDYTYVLDEEEVYKGNTIVKEGKHGTWFWVIMGGIAEIVKERAARSSVFFLPILSVIVPEIIQPRIVPSRADETTQPSIAGVNSKCD